MSAARSQDPDTYERALASADWVRNRIGVPLAGLDVGGGFPAEYGRDPNAQGGRDAVARAADVAASGATSRNGSSAACRWSPSPAG